MRVRNRAFSITLVAAGLVAVAAPSGAAAASREAKTERLMRHVRGDLNGILAQARAQLIELSKLPSVNGRDAKACTTDMTARAGDPRYTAFGAADASGSLYCLSIPFTPPVSVADRAYFLRAIGTVGFGVGDFQIGRVTGQGAVGLGFPVAGGAGGIVLATLALAWLGPHVEARLRAPARNLLVFDDHGTLLADAGPNPIVSGTNLGSSALVRKALRVERSVGNTRFAGRKVFAAIDIVPLSSEALHVAVTTAPS